MNNLKKLLKNYKFLCILLFILLVLTATLGIIVGSVSLNSKEVWKIIINKLFNKEIFEKTWKNNIEIIVWNIRAPRIINGILAGGALSLVGILMQCLTKNPLASPYILGISAGASTGAVFAIIFFNHLLYSVPIFAFIFGTLVTLLVFFCAGTKNFSSTRLVLVGVAIASFFSGITSLIIHLAPKENELRSALFWMSGSLSGSNWKYIPLSFISLIISFLLIYPKYKEFNIMVTGEENAIALGVNTSKVRLLIIVVSTFLTGVVVSNVGIIGFVGLVIPHICRSIVGGNHKKIIPMSILLGALFLLSTDTITRTLFEDREIPIGVITSLFGAPFFLNMLRKNGFKFGGE